MASFHFTVEQVSFSSEDLPIDSSSLDSLSSVVDPNVDFIIKESSNVSSNETSDAEWKLTNRYFSKNTNKMEEHKKSNSAHVEKTNDPNPEVMQSKYPTIPIAVAHCINQNNPEICQGAEKYFKSDNFKMFPNYSEGNYVTPNLLPATPLHSMSATSEALALQHSVIGNSTVTPASPDIVAELVAKTKLRLEQKELKNTDSNIKQNGNTSCEKPDIISKNELIRYPSEIISSTVEKRSWFSNNSYYESSNEMIPKTSKKSSPKTNLLSRSSSQSSINSATCKKSPRTNETNLPKVHSSKTKGLRSPRQMLLDNSESPYEQYPESSFDYETESSISEKFEIESVCSEAFETESNFSEISGVDDEMFQIRQLLDTPKRTSGNLHNKSSDHNILHKKDANTSPIRTVSGTSDKATETDEQNFLLLREKASLEGRLESVTKDQSDLIKERDFYSSLATSYEAQLKSLQNQLETTASEKKNALMLYDAQTKENSNWDNIIKEYQNIIETKNSEIKALKDDLSDREQEIIKARIGCEELKLDLESKDGATTGLKKKIAELHVEVQINLQGKIQLENEVKNIRLEMETLQKSKDWFQEQLHSTQENRNKLHQQLIITQNELNSISTNLESAFAEKNHLKLELSYLQQRAVAEKEVLMKRLETIEADMKERESLFDEIQKDKGSAEDSLIDRIRKLEEEKSNLMKLSFTVSDQEFQLNSLNAQVEEKSNYIQSLEKEKAELHKHLAILQKTANDKDMEVQKLIQQIKDFNTKVNCLETKLQHSEEVINGLKEERTATDVALASANEEKRVVNETLKTVSENLNKFKSNFKHMKTELIAQTSRADQMLKEKTLLEEALKKNDEGMQLLRKEYEQQMHSESQNRNVMLDDLQKKKNDVESVLTVYSKDLLNYQQLADSLAKEKIQLKNELSSLKQNLKEAEDRLKLYSEEKALLTQTVSDYKNSNAFNGNEPINPSQEHDRKLLKSKTILFKKLKEKIKECKALKEELENIKFANANVPCENCTELRSNEKSNIEYDNKIKDLEQLLNEKTQLLEEKLLVLQRNEDTIIELEKEKGKTIGYMDKYNILKQHMNEIEVKLTEKESSEIQLTCLVEELKAKINETEESTKNKIANMDSDLKKERAWVKELRNQISKEERANSQLQRDMLSLKSGLEQANQVADSRKLEISSLQAELSLKVQAELKHRAELEHLQTEIRLQHSVAEKLQKELEEVKARDPALAEQLKALSWKVKEKTNEAAALQNKLKLLEEHHSSELSILKKNMEETETLLESIKEELSVTRKEKFNYQSKVIELRKALKSKLAELESKGILKVENKYSDNGPIIHLNIPDPEVSFDEEYVNSILQKSMKLSESRPLNNLQDCLNSLKQEMVHLQQKIIESTSDT